MSIFRELKEMNRTLEEPEIAEETVWNYEVLTPEEKARMDFFVELSDKMESFFDRLEDMLGTFGEGIARLLVRDIEESDHEENEPDENVESCS